MSETSLPDDYVSPLLKWRDLAIPRLPGASEALIAAELLIVIDDFCRESTAWRGMIYNRRIIQCQREVQLDPVDNNRRVNSVHAVYYSDSGRMLNEVSHVNSNVVQRPLGWTANGDNGGSSILLDRIPDDSTDCTTLNMWVSYLPTDATIWLPNVLLDEHWETIYNGLLGRLYAEPNKPYYNAERGKYYTKRYRQRTRQAMAQAKKGYTGNAQNWSYPRFGR